MEIDFCDKGGNFVGWLYYEGKNLSVTLVMEGLSKVHPQARRFTQSKDLFIAQKMAKTEGKKLWMIKKE